MISFSAAGEASFGQGIDVATELRGGYQVVITDMNRDGRPDLIALASGLDELLWFENTGDMKRWPRHVIVKGQKRMINCAAHDTDGDGIPEIVLASLFDNLPKNSIGGVSVLHHTGDPKAMWEQREIDKLTTSHRIRWADIDGSGKKVAVNAPLAGAGGDAPDFQANVPLVYYRPGDWKRETINVANRGVVHGIFVAKAGRRDAILTASFLGVHRHVFDGKNWQRTEITKGDPAPWPKSGTSDIAVANSYMAAIEPWHGSQVVVYEKGKRTVIDTTLDQGHSVQIIDGKSFVVGHRGPKGGVNLYRQERGRWTRTVLDEGLKANSCEVANLDGQGVPDIACIGGSTANLRIYLSPAKSGH